jgi:hypothetical protein
MSAQSVHISGYQAICSTKRARGVDDTSIYTSYSHAAPNELGVVEGHSQRATTSLKDAEVLAGREVEYLMRWLFL